MKKILFVLMLFVSIGGFAQSNNTLDSIQIQNQSEIRYAGYYLEKSAKMQYSALACAGAGGLLAVLTPTIFKDKASSVNPSETKSNKDLRNISYCISGALGAAAIVCQILSIQHKMTSGRILRFYGNQSGVGISYSF